MPLSPIPSLGKITELGPLTGTSATFAFTSIRQDLRKIYIELTGRGDTAATTVTVGMRLNGDSTANYDREQLSIVQATATATETLAASSIIVGTLAAANAAAGHAGSVFIEFPLYAGATFRKVVLCRSGLSVADATGGVSGQVITGKWRSTAAISAITLFPAAGNFDVGSYCCLWGVV